MYVSDRKVTHGLAMLALLVGPWLGVSRGIGGWVLEVALLIAVLAVGRNKGFGLTTLCLFLGYGVALLAGGGLSSLAHMGFLPWVGLFAIWGTAHTWPRRFIFFGCLVLAGILGVLPIIPVIQQGIDPEVMKDLIRTMLDQYRQSGMLATLTQQGLSEADIQDYLQHVLQYLFLFVPGLTALGAMIEYSAVHYFFARLFPQEDLKLPLFSSFRLPWFAIWGVNLGIASYLIGDQWGWTFLRVFGMNLMFIYACLAFTLGSSIFLYYIRSPFLSGLVKWILLLTSFIYFQVTIVSLVLLGLFDLVLDFRRIPEDNQ